jgi:hypothetical protein
MSDIDLEIETVSQVNFPLSMNDIFLLAFEKDENGYMGIPFKIYIDDSADRERKKYVVAGAIIGSAREWKSFGRKWRQELKEPPSIDYFHQKEFVSLKGEFEQFNRVAANLKRDRLRKAFEDSEIYALGIAVLIPGYEWVRAERPDASKFFPKDAFEIALQETLNQCVKVLRERDPKADLMIISDISSKSARYSEVFEGFKRKNPISARHLRGIMHLDDQKVTGLQVADLCAGVIKREFDQHAAGEFKLPLPELDGKFYRLGYWDRERALAVLEHQEVQYGV